MLITFIVPVGLNVSNAVNAADYSLNSLYTYKSESYLSITDKTATCTSILVGYETTTKITFTQTLQRKNSSGIWETVATWNKTRDISAGSVTNKKTALVRGTYRLKTVFTVFAGVKHETITNFSTECTVK